MGTVLNGLSHICGIGYDIASGGFKCAFTEKGAEVEGIRSLTSFSPQLVAVSLKRGRLEIAGENLSILRLSRGYIAVSGTVSSISLSEGRA